MKFKNSYATLDTRLFNKQPPNPLTNPKPGHFNPIVAQQIGWDEDTDLMKNWVNILSGEYVPEGFDPLAMAYAGHQFGHWAGQLGDGRGLLMAQVVDKQGQLTDLHLKGMGLTPYSRMGDGRAVLRSTIREYLCGHAMSSLGIPSSNALGFVTSETPVRREQVEHGAALLRVADTHIRLGHVEWIASFAPDLLANFTKYMIETYYPELSNSETPILDFIEQVIKNTAEMIADWQLVGFAHGVMNTDNLTITGSTFDYGPFGFLERFNPAWINNHSDYTGRYTYQNQPAIGRWNLSVWSNHFMRLADKPIFYNHTTGEPKPAEPLNRQHLEARLNRYDTYFSRHYQQGICAKLGLPWQDASSDHNGFMGDDSINNRSIDNDSINNRSIDNDSIDNDSIENETSYAEHAQNNTSLQTLTLAFELLEIIETNYLDYTNCFRSLIAIIEPNQHAHETALLEQITQELEAPHLAKWQDWQRRYLEHIERSITSPFGNNVETAGDSRSVKDVVACLTHHNPVYILRNAMAQKSIEAGESGDFSEVDRLFTLLQNPYVVQDIATEQDCTPPAKDEHPIIVSCSS